MLLTLVRVVRWNSRHAAQTQQQNTRLIELKFHVRLKEKHKWESSVQLTELQEELRAHRGANMFDDPAA